MRQCPTLRGTRSRNLAAIFLRKPFCFIRRIIKVYSTANSASGLKLQARSVQCRCKRDGPACKQLHLRIGERGQVGHHSSVDEYRRTRRVRGPTGELIVSASERIGRKHVLGVVGEVLVGHRLAAVSAVAVELDRVGIRSPLRVERHRAVERQVRHFNAVRVNYFPVGGRRPARECVARASECV